jgi:hypothetical protein
MEVNDLDPIGSKIQLEICRENLKHSEDKIRQIEQELTQVNRNLGRKEKELEQVKEERTDFKTRWRLLQNDLQYARDALAQNSQVGAKKRTRAKRQAFLVSLIFLVSSILVNFGTSKLTSSPLDLSLGWSLLALAVVTYIIGASMTTLLALGGES